MKADSYLNSLARTEPMFRRLDEIFLATWQMLYELDLKGDRYDHLVKSVGSLEETIEKFEDGVLDLENRISALQRSDNHSDEATEELIKGVNDVLGHWYRDRILRELNAAGSIALDGAVLETAELSSEGIAGSQLVERLIAHISTRHVRSLGEIQNALSDIHEELSFLPHISYIRIKKKAIYHE